MKRCPKCGRRIRRGAFFCENCGIRLSAGKYYNGRMRKKSRRNLLLMAAISICILCAGFLFLQKDAVDNRNLSQEEVSKILGHYCELSSKISHIVGPYEDLDGYIDVGDTEAALIDVSRFAEELFKRGEITDYHYKTGDSCVYMEIDGWLGLVYEPQVRDVLSGNGTIEVVTLEPFSSEFKTFFAYFASGAEGPDEGAGLIEENVGGFSFTSNLNDGEITIDTIRNLPNNSVIVWTGHGSYSDEYGPMICLNDVDVFSDLSHYQKEIASKAILVTTSGGIRVTSEFFNSFVERETLNGCLVYINTCYSFIDNRLANSILNLGAVAYIGNSAVTNSIYAFDMVYGFLEGLTPVSTGFYYRSVQDALAYAKLKHGATDWAMGGEVRLICRYDFALPEMIAVKDGAYQIKSGGRLNFIDKDNKKIESFVLYAAKSYKFCEQYTSEGPDISADDIIANMDYSWETSSGDIIELNLQPGVYEIAFVIGNSSETGTIQILKEGSADSLTITSNYSDGTDKTNGIHSQINAHNGKKLAQVNVTYSDGSKGQTVFKYNSSGLLASSVFTSAYSDGSQETVYSYDRDNRLTTVQLTGDHWHAGFPSAEYNYDVNGYLIRSAGGEGSIIEYLYENDSAGLPVKVTMNSDFQTTVSNYTYSESGNAAEVIISVTDYQGNQSQDYASYKFTYDILGRIQNETRNGTDYSYNHNYIYDYFPFVCVASGSSTPHKIYIADIKGHPIWEIENVVVKSMKQDADGYLTQLITDSGVFYEFVYETQKRN